MDEDGEYLVADDDEMLVVVDVIESVEAGESERAVARKADIAHPTTSKILDQCEAHRVADRGARLGNGFAIIWPDEDSVPANDCPNLCRL